jgi:manganese transport protein
MTTTEQSAVVSTGQVARRRLAPNGAGRWARTLPFLGPAFVAAVAYVDPGNFATNFSGGASFGYRLLWVIVAANLMAMLIQSLTAKLGVATGQDLATLCRTNLRRPVVWGLWVQAEAVAIATDIAEIVGGAVALNLLFNVPLPVGGAVTSVVAFALLTAQGRGHRPFELVIGGLLVIIAAGFGYTLIFARADPVALTVGLVPGFAGTESVLLATGILGATVMPHVIYVHSALTPKRYALSAGPSASTGLPERHRVLRTQRLDVLIAMGAAGLVNAAMLTIAAALFFNSGVAADGLEEVHAGLGLVVGGAASIAFAVALLASGLAASAVGTYAGQVVMAGFLRRRIPIFVRRLITAIPAIAILALGADPTMALVVSQVVLSFGIPFALIPLVWFTSRSDIMGQWVNRPITTVTASAVAGLIICLNAYLLVTLLPN